MNRCFEEDAARRWQSSAELERELSAATSRGKRTATAPAEHPAGAPALDGAPRQILSESAATKTLQPLRARQEIRYCTTSDGVRLAYASVGSGPPLVKASNWLTHLDLEWGSPIWRHWWAELSAHHRVVRYDERGIGMSQWDVSDVHFETWVRDLEAVVDAAGLDRFPLLGISRGGSIALAYAAKHPDRVSHLVLYGAFAAGTKYVGTPEEIEARRALISLTRLG